MEHTNKESVVVAAIMALFVLSSVMSPAAAAQAAIKEEQFERVYTPNANNHTYVYRERDLSSEWVTTTLHVDQDLQVRRYYFEGEGWGYEDTSYSAPDDAALTSGPFGLWPKSTFTNESMMPAFINAVGAGGGPAVLNMTLARSSFQLTMGQVSTLVLDPNQYYHGTLWIGAEEFVYLTISSRQVTSGPWTVLALDPKNRFMGLVQGTDNASIVFPFRPSVSGIYHIVIIAEANSQNLLVFDLLPQAAAVTQVATGQLVQNVLEDSEFVVTGDSGSVVDTKKTPTAHTYKFYSEDVALISYSFSYPGSSEPVDPPIETTLEFSSDAFVSYFDHSARFNSVVYMPQSSIIYYRSSNGEAYYVTVFGTAGVKYTLFHKGNVAEDLPMNREFFVTNNRPYEVTSAYSLRLAQDSFMKLNSSASAADYDWTAWAVYGNDMYIPQNLQWHSTLQGSSFYYLPAGNYVFEVTAGAYISDQFEFNIGPVHDEPTAQIARVGGFRVSTNTMTYYNTTLKLLTLDNITVRANLAFYDRYAISAASSSPILANRVSGTHWAPHPIYSNSTDFLTTNTLTQDYSLVAVCTYRVSDNTEGVTNDYVDYPVNYGIECVDYTNDYFGDTFSLSVGSAPQEHNFTLGLPGEATEYYQLELSVPKGVWFNVSVIAEDVDAFSAMLLQNWHLRTQRTPWGDLNDELVGSIGTELSFQFGSISDSMKLILSIGRDLSDNGSLYVKITPFNTTAFAALPAPFAEQADFLSGLLVYVVPLAVGVGVIAVAAVVYVKKFRK